uniref:Uncharacterized protein n=1 Tax=Lygus hesperus TaxID=30085 RepID=A0A0K8SMJ7_LYGHE
MPPKRKPVQKEQKPIEEVATDTALVSLENVEEEVDNPVDDIPVQAASKKAANKKPKKTNNQQKVSELKGEEKEQRPEEEVGKENVESVKNEEETFITKERPELTRRGARRGHPVEIAPSTHVSGDNVGADAIPERDIDQDNVKVLISGDETSKKEAPPRRGAKRAVHKNDAASSDQEGNGDFEENPQNQNESP